MCSSKNGSRGGASLSELWVSRRSLGIRPCSVLWPGFGSSVLLRPSPGTGRPGTTKTRCLKHVLVFPTVGAAFRRIPRQSPRAVGQDVMGSKFCSPFLGRAGRGRRKPCVRKNAASVSHSWTPHLAEFLGSRLGWSAGTSWVQNFARPSWALWPGMAKIRRVNSFADIPHRGAPHFAEFLGSCLGQSGGTSWVQNFARPSWHGPAGSSENQMSGTCCWCFPQLGTVFRRPLRRLPRAAGRGIMV